MLRVLSDANKPTIVEYTLPSTPVSLKFKSPDHRFNFHDRRQFPERQYSQAAAQSAR